MSNSEIKKKISFIDEDSRAALGISRDEYALCSYIYFRAQDGNQKHAGWCCDPKEDIANFIGISRVAVYSAVKKMACAGLVETAQNGAVRPSKKWLEVEGNCKETLQKMMGESVKFLYTDCKVSLQNDQEKCKETLQSDEKKCKETLQSDEKKCKVSLHTPYKRLSYLDNTLTQPDGCLVSDGCETTTNAQLGADAGAPPPKISASEKSGYSFDDFWSDYDFKKGSKTGAKQKWDKLSEKQIAAVRDTLDFYKRDTVTDDAQRGDKFKPMRKYPQFFLSGRVWEAYADAAAAELERERDEWDEPYEKYVQWVAKRYPTVFRNNTHLSKSEYVCHRTEYYVEGMSFIGDHNIQNILVRAHDNLEKGMPKAVECGSVFKFQVHMLKERVKSRTV